MDYIELICKIDPMQPFADILVAELSEIGYDSFAEEEDGIKAYICKDNFDIDQVHQLHSMQSVEVHIQLSYAPLENKNWNAEWESQYLPVDIDGKCYIRAPFHQPQPQYDYNIIISPKMSFGTAHHDTTAQMIRLILAENVKHKQVLDMGSGTAILAILAALKGASKIDAIDNDRWAYENALENIDMNHCNTQVQAVLGTADDIEETKMYELVLANIHKNVLLKDMATYVQHMTVGAKLFLSGFYISDIDDMILETKRLGLSYIGHQSQNEWAVILLQK